MGSTKKLTVKVPASSANLGPGFDTLALAYKLYCTLTFELEENGSKKSSGPIIELKGKATQSLPKTRENLVVTTMEKSFPSLSESINHMKITIDSDIPLARGLGSSAACIAGSIWAGLHFSGQEPDKDTALQHAAAIEGHPDNVAASLFGGVVASAKVQKPSRFLAASMKWPQDWCPILVVPDHEVSTAHARSVLPQRVSMAEAVSNIQNTALLLMAIEKQDPDLLRAGLADNLHEQHRQELIPELQKVRDALRGQSLIGVVLSGAGSSILVLAERRDRDEIVSQLNSWSLSQGGKAQVMSLEVDEEGIQASHE